MSDISGIISQTEQKYGLPPGILAATIQVESHGNPAAVSPKGALGIAQLMPATAKGLGADPWNVPQAIDAAGRLWSQNLKASGGDIDKAAMMYNAGNDPRHWNNPETQAYPRKLAAALGPASSQPQQASGDPIESALTSSGSPQQSAPAPSAGAPQQGGGDPIEAALSSQQPPQQDYSAVNQQMRDMFHKGASTADIVKYGLQHGISPNPDQIDLARKNGSDVQFVQPQQQADQPQQPPQTNEALGFLEGIAKPIDNAATWLEQGANKIGLAKPLNDLGSAIGLAPSAGAANAAQQGYFKGQEAQGQTPGKIGEFAGSIAGTLPAMIATKNPWIGGAISGAAETDNPNNLKQTGIDALVGALGGKVTHALTGAVSSTIAPQVSKAVQALNDAGVSLTPGQIVGGALRRIEDGATSIPFVGDLIKNAQRRSVLSMNSSAINSVLAPLKQSLPNGLSGREAVDYADQAVTKAYNGLLPKLNVQATKGFYDNVAESMKDLNRLPADRAEQVQNIIKNDVLDRFKPDWTMGGQDFKDADEALGTLRRQYSGAQDPDQRQMGQIFGNVQANLRAMLSEANPGHAAELNSINQAFANLVRVEGAAGSAGAKGGVFSPSQLAAAVKRGDSSARDKAYATGKALLQNLSDPANEVLPQTVPDSGTPYRTVGAYLLGGGLSHLSPFAAPLAAVPGLYTKTGQAAFQKIMLAPRTPAEKALARTLSHLKAPLAVAGGAASAEAAHDF